MNAMIDQKIIPMPKVGVPINETSERAALSCLTRNFKNLDVMAWPEDLFFYEKHKIVLRAIRELHETGVPSDYFAIQSYLEKKGLIDEVGGQHELMEIHTVMGTGDPGSASWHREILMDARRYRRALDTVRKAETEFLKQEGDIASVAEALNQAAAMRETTRKGIKDLITGLTIEMEKKEPTEAFYSGLKLLDNVAALKRGELLTIAAPTSGGKSIMLLQLALQAMRAGKRVAVFSLEMPASQVVARLLSAMCGFNISVLRHINRKDANNEQLKIFNAAAAELARFHIEVDSNLTEWEAIDGAARELVAKNKADIIIVDYIQLIHLRALGSNETREQHVSEITKRLKSLALHLNVAVATASQLNDDNPPKLRESRAIGHHSDHVWFITYGDNGGFLTVKKNRDGERGSSIPILMDGAAAKFLPRDERNAK